ncbi:hypothetical protein [Brochothrix thermosphacta]|uniref:hypothetical protein n=1 Tax=Brochothrix thermosphacta TaxID=2756 RepID=UPI003F90972B
MPVRTVGIGKARPAIIFIAGSCFEISQVLAYFTGEKNKSKNKRSATKKLEKIKV